MADHPRAQTELRQELDDVLAGGEPTWDDLPRLSYARAVVEEGLRLYPPAWIVTRKAAQDTTVAGLAVPAGTLVMISPWLLHRRAAEWPDPEAFRPERFLDVRSASLTAGGSYVPFGAGPRLCIGRDLALTEAVLVLARVMRGRSVSAAGPVPPIDALVTLRARGGMPLVSGPA